MTESAPPVVLISERRPTWSSPETDKETKENTNVSHNHRNPGLRLGVDQRRTPLVRLTPDDLYREIYNQTRMKPATLNAAGFLLRTQRFNPPGNADRDREQDLPDQTGPLQDGSCVHCCIPELQSLRQLRLRRYVPEARV